MFFKKENHEKSSNNEHQENQCSMIEFLTLAFKSLAANEALFRTLYIVQSGFVPMEPADNSIQNSPRI